MYIFGMCFQRHKVRKSDWYFIIVTIQNVMRPQSCKAKGRRLQQIVCSDLLEIFPQLEADDIRSTSMGCNGEDCQLSPAARKLIPCSIECKNVERLNIWSTIDQAVSNAGNHHPMIVMKRNNIKPWAAVPWTFLLELLKSRVDRETRTCNQTHHCETDEDMSEPNLDEKHTSNEVLIDDQIAMHIAALSELIATKKSDH
jgi:acetylglutamate synthase